MSEEKNSDAVFKEEVFERKPKKRISAELETEYTDFLDLINKNTSEAIRVLIRKVKADMLYKGRKEYLQLAAIGCLVLAVSLMLSSFLGYVFMGLGVIIIGYAGMKIFRLKQERM